MLDVLQEEMTSKALTDRIHFFGFVEDGANFLAQLDIFVLPSISDGFSIATLEAMATRIPVVVSKCGGPEEIVTLGEDALMVPVADGRAIGLAISPIIELSTLAERLGRQAASSVESRFSIDLMVGQYEILYASLF